MNLADLGSVLIVFFLLAISVVPFVWMGVVLWDTYQDNKRFKASLTADDINKIASSRLVGNGFIGWQNEAFVTMKQAWLLRRK